MKHAKEIKNDKHDEKRQIVVQQMLAWRGNFCYTNDCRRENPENTVGGLLVHHQRRLFEGSALRERPPNSLPRVYVGAAAGRSIRQIDVSPARFTTCCAWGGRVSHVEMYAGVIDGRHVTKYSGTGAAKSMTYMIVV